MKVIYKLPQVLVLVAFAGIVATIIYDINQAQTETLFDLIKRGDSTVRFDVTILGMDLYTILNNIVALFLVVLAVLRRNLIDVKTWIAVLIALLLFFQTSYGASGWILLEDALSETALSVITMTGQYMYGTVPLTLIMIWLLAKILKKDVWMVLDYIAPLWLILLSFVRLACFTAGCCGVDACNIADVNIALPVQLLEVAINLILLQIVFNIERKGLDEEGAHNKKGCAFFIAIGGHAVFRFLIDFGRSVPVAFAGLTFGQVYSVICIIAAVVVLLKIKNRKC